MRCSATLITFILFFYNTTWAATKSPPNIILILADDLGYDDLSFRGNNEILTPNIDALGYHGKILKHFYTNPMCTPTRASLLSGKYSNRLGLQHSVIANNEDRSLPLNVTTLPEVLRNAGYATHLVGKWHLGFAKKEYTPTYRGFDHHFGYWGSYIDYYRRNCQISGENKTYGYDFHRDMTSNCESPNKYITDLFADEAERIISQNNGNQPLFLMINHAAPHAANENERLQAPAEDIEKFSYIKEEQHRIYAAMVHRLDESVGRVVRAVDEAGMLDNTIIIFSSDNGAPTVDFLTNTGSNWPLKGQKAGPWEGANHVGGVIWSKLISNRGSIFKQRMHISDWFPTLAKAAGVKIEEDLALDGLDLWDQITSPNNEVIEREILHILDEVSNVTSYMNGAFKYVKGSPDNGIYDKVLRFRELYDVSTDNYTHQVFNSLASLSLQKFDASPLTVDHINDLRNSAGVKCQSEVRRDCNALLEECLYNINEDPCEENNLSYLSQYQELMADMRQRIEVFRQNSVPMILTDDNILNDPSYHQCRWANFAQEPPSAVPATCDVNTNTLFCPVYY